MAVKLTVWYSGCDDPPKVFRGDRVAFVRYGHFDADNNRIRDADSKGTLCIESFGGVYKFGLSRIQKFKAE